MLPLPTPAWMTDMDKIELPAGFPAGNIPYYTIPLNQKAVAKRYGKESGKGKRVHGKGIAAV